MRRSHRTTSSVHGLLLTNDQHHGRVTVHGCTVRSPLPGCQVTSRPRDRFSKYSKWLDTFRTALVRPYQVYKDRQCKYKRNTEARYRNHCYRGSAISITHSEYVCGLSYPACKAHAPYYIAICSASGSTIFSHIIS